MSEQTLDAFLFYRSYRDALNGMTKKDQLETLLAIIDYALYGVEPKLTGKMPSSVFTVTRPIIDSNNARRKAGKRGGRPKKETIGLSTGETIGFQSEKPGPLYNRETKKQETKEQRNREISPLPPQGETTGFGPELSAAFDEWLRYKQERRESYKPTGLEALKTRVRNQAAVHGEQAVADCIQLSMSNGWKGIVFDRLENVQKKPDRRTAVKTDADYANSESFV